MIPPRVIPVLLLRGRGLYKTVKFKDPIYVGDPLNTVRLFNEKEANEIVVLDIGATADGRGPNFEFLEDLASECFMPFAYGGGITTVDEIKKQFGIGYNLIINRKEPLEGKFEHEQEILARVKGSFLDEKMSTETRSQYTLPF